MLQRTKDIEAAENLVDAYFVSSENDEVEYEEDYSDPDSRQYEKGSHKKSEIEPIHSPNSISYSLRKLEKRLLEDAASMDDDDNDDEEIVDTNMHVIRQHKSVDNDQERKENGNNPGIVVRVTQKAFHFAATNLMRIFREEINDRPLKEFSRILMRLNVSILAPRITHVSMPELGYRALSENSIKISSIGGSTNVNGKYRAVYKTVREGKFKVQMENFDVNLRIKFTKTFAGYLQLVDMSCDAVVRSVVVHLSPKLHEQIDEGLRETVTELTQQKICEVVELYVQKIDTRLQSLARYSPLTFETKSIASQLRLDTTLNDEAVLSDGYLDIPLKGAFIVDSDTKTPFNPSPISKSEEDADRMIYVYASDYVINSFFYQLDRLGNFRMNLHRIPEVMKMLRLDCSDDEECLGQILENPEQYTNNTGIRYSKFNYDGRMEAHVRSPPVVVLNDVGAHIGLNLSVDISYKETDEEEKVRAVLLTFHVKLQLHAHGLSINNTSPEGEQQRFRINTSISISHMEVSSAIAYVESMNEFAAQLPSYLEEKKSLIEELVRKNLHVVVPLSVNEIIGVNSIYGLFRARTLVLGFDVGLHEKLFEHFGLTG
ncbi:unnamed protein product [Toxocara canis]|uniref:Lipid-binding serum glycoprotein C-terminal domain-containing protein n=1 Tax=Toxocara canis TaxID=6265 RepID=A0A3P7G267_TOXCA|nr:unnamed protein product [Toxocara canis]